MQPYGMLDDPDHSLPAPDAGLVTVPELALPPATVVSGIPVAFSFA